MSPTPTILITGATDGIGRETAERLAASGADLILHGRSQAKLDAVLAQLDAVAGRGELSTVVADLSDLDQVRRLAAQVDERVGERGLDVLLNNAGVYQNERKTGAQGHELTWAVNYLAPVLLGELLLPALRRSSSGGRIINVSSIAHTRGQLRWDDFEFTREFSPYAAYAQSKLAIVMHTVELARRLGEAGPLVVSLHPGVVSTKLLTEGFGMHGSDSLDEGAATSVYLALLPSAELRTQQGAYFVRKQVAAMNPITGDRQACARLFERTREILGLDA